LCSASTWARRALRSAAISDFSEIPTLRGGRSRPRPALRHYVVSR
jgi:hypothetical protein